MIELLFGAVILVALVLGVILFFHLLNKDHDKESQE